MAEEITSKLELIARIQASRAALESALAQIAPDAMETPGVTNDWTVKDVLFHITAWEGVMMNTLSAVSANRAPDHADSITDEMVDDMNAGFYATAQVLDLDAVQSSFQRIHTRAMAAVETCSEDDLFDPTRLPWREGQPLWQHVGGNTFWHYEEHLDALQSWAQAHPA